MFPSLISLKYVHCPLRNVQRKVTQTKTFQHVLLPCRPFKVSSKVKEVEKVGVQRDFKKLFQPFLFTISVGCVSYVGASIWQYENLRRKVRKINGGVVGGGGGGGWSSSTIYGKAGSIRRELNHWWNGLSAGERTVVAIMALNFGVFLLWRVPQFQPTMIKYFTASPYSGAPCVSMFLSSFSHHSFFHLFANMYVLWSFTPSISAILGQEQFLATYVTAAVVSSFGSYIFKIARCSLSPSIGASGAIMAVLGMVCSRHPDAHLSIAFVDKLIPHSFSAGSALYGIILLDMLGIVLRWKLFDHAAHLAGMFFGLWYLTYGNKLIWQKREPIITTWHNLRHRPKE
ncbi:hypothetical protein HELRODRAFT_114574 [Helobdella robusta]|uniref:rhomboid protease n=1 Tax=Helobdella robusta TaxID=6412 RepID=T1EG31_HELRO|nr:hypothetical protein HELRODRAFT_114574 [Helobdella robusta]ESN95762.1 hypothetical protein HELRODRAFT_114574 [Helobdella robusta]